MFSPFDSFYDARHSTLSPMPRQSDARQKMIESAALLFRVRGVQGTSFTDVLSHSGAPRGSIYHHFQGGKTQLAEEATQWAGEFIVAGTVAALAESDPVEAIDTFRRRWTKTLRGSDFAAGCPIVAATLEGDREPTVRDAAGRAFSSWEQVLADAFREHHIPRDRARSMATLLIAAIEGAIVVARAQRTTRPLERVSVELQRVVSEGLSQAETVADLGL
jgi:TetR/AcrR family transcriptional regulator, lmrAB and yxaGH operons repressor